MGQSANSGHLWPGWEQHGQKLEANFDVSKAYDESHSCSANYQGVAGKGGICMPSVGRSESRAYTAEELGDHTKLLGESTFDIYLNGVTYFRNVPEHVWQLTLGGYQVLKKWLSYRETILLGRPLTLEEVEYFQKTTRRIAAILLLGDELNANYAEVCGGVYAWPE
jgi:hypothetical protein